MVPRLTSVIVSLRRTPVMFLWGAGICLIVACLGMVPASNAKLLPREERKPSPPSSLPSSSKAPLDSQEEALATQKLQRMQAGRSKAWSQGTAGSLGMTMERFQELIFDPPRKFSALVMFYSEKCEGCEDAIDSFEMIALAFKNTYENGGLQPKEELFFAKVKITGGYRQVLDLDLRTSYPNLFHFAPSTSSHSNEFEQMDRKLMWNENGRFDFDQMIKWIHTIRPDMKFKVVKKSEPQSLFNPVNLCAAALIGMWTLFYLFYFGHFETLVECLKDFNYAYFISFIMVWLLSGQMYNYMRHTATMGSGGFSQISTYIYPGSRYQYGIESVIVMLIYALMIWGVIELIRAREMELGMSQEERLTYREGDAEAMLQRNNQSHENAVMGAMSCLFFGYLMLQLITHIKT